MQFANCGINGIELNGPLVHVRGGGAIGAGSYTTIDWEFNALDITESSRIVTVTGTASRYTSTTGSMGAGCTGERDSNIALSFTVNTSSAAIIDALNTVNVTDNQYEQYMQDTFIGLVGEPEGPCSPLRYVGFSGTAIILSTEFGPKSAQVQKSGVSVLEGIPDGDLLAGGTISGPAMLSVDFNDGSTPDIVQPTEIDGKSQVTITSEGVTSTFNDESFRFDF